jgi:hypothetical protein
VWLLENLAATVLNADLVAERVEWNPWTVTQMKLLITAISSVNNDMGV